MIISVIVLQPLKLMRAAYRRHNCEIRLVKFRSDGSSESIERSFLFVLSQSLSELHAFFPTVDHERIVFSQP